MCQCHLEQCKKQDQSKLRFVGKDDKRQITAVFGCSIPSQSVYKGKTRWCLPCFQFPHDWDITFTQHHWSNEDATQQYIVKILFLPYLQRKRKGLNTFPNSHGLLIIDNFNGHCAEEVLKFLDSNSVNVVMVPPKCTDSTNKPAKGFLCQTFYSWSTGKEDSKGTC